MAIALYLLAGSTESLLFKLVIVGIPFSLPFITVFLFAFWWTRLRRNNNNAAPRVLRIISALVMFQLGIVATLFWYYVKDEAINHTSAERYKEASRKIQVGMTKAEVIELMGAPADMNVSKDEVELWWWQSHHRRERPLTYKIIGKSVYEAEPFLLLTFDNSERVDSVTANLEWQ
jgi:outer membrane protein assembly factor BamE (lipoprotein component of BamABCDE complex)